MTVIKLAMCPTCNYNGEFELLGEQHWPPEVAQRLGLPAVIKLWSCPHCMTTVSEPDLLPHQPPRNIAPERAEAVMLPLTHSRKKVAVEQSIQ
jgi:hypothetical protein